MGTRVVKVGGSLWAQDSPVVLLQSWLRCQPRAHNVLVPGGGEYAEQIRRLDQGHPGTNEAAHWLAIRAMSLLAWTIGQLDARWTYQDNWHGLCRTITESLEPCTVVFDPANFLRVCEPGLTGIRLPIGWQVTSDSIAARVAGLLGAHELVLLKSSLPSASCALQASQQGFVDPFFPEASRACQSIRCVDLLGQRQMVW
jgi:aspartokinase-like uncharacterized kinase